MTPFITDANAYDNLRPEEKIGILIFICREQRNISRKQLASKINKTVEVVSAIENLFRHREGKRQSITYDEIVVIAEALGVPISQILPQ